MSEKTKMASKEMEASILYAMFKFGQDALNIASPLINDDDFFYPGAKLVWHKFNEFYVKNEKKCPSFPGLKTYIASCQDITDDDTCRLEEIYKLIEKKPIKKEEIEGFCKQIRNYYVMRKVVKSWHESVDKFGVEETSKIISSVSSKMSDLNFKLHQKIAKSQMKFIAQVDEREQMMIKTKNNPEELGLISYGIPAFDTHPDIPPIPNGSFGLYMARTGVGKSIMLMSTAIYNLAKVDWDGKPKKSRNGIIITIEMSDSQYAKRMDSNISKYSHTFFVNGKLTDDSNKVNVWKSSVKTYADQDKDCIIYWVPKDCTLRVVDDIIRNNPFHPEFVIVDYAGDMKAHIKNTPEHSATAQGEIYCGLKEIAGDHLTVLFTAQQVKSDQKELTTESGSWSKIASDRSDIVIGIDETSDDKTYRKNDNEIFQLTVMMLKSRHSKKVTCKIRPDFDRMSWSGFTWDKERVRIAEEIAQKEAKKKGKKVEVQQGPIEVEEVDKKPESNKVENKIVKQEECVVNANAIGNY